MKPLGKKRKKELPPEKRAKRLCVIASALAVMIIISALPSKKHTRVTERYDPKPALDASVDSLIASLGFRQYTITSLGDINTVEETPYNPYLDSVDMLEMKKGMTLAMPGIPEEERNRSVAAINATIERYTDSAKAFDRQAATSSSHSRKVRFSTPDGGMYMFFQQIPQGSAVSKAKHFNITRLPDEQQDNL